MILIRFAQPRAFFIVTTRGSSHGIPYLDTDVPASLSDCAVNCCDTSLSQSIRICLRIHWHVLLSFDSFVWLICRSLVSYQIRDGKIMKTNGKPSASTLPNQIEVNVDTSCGRHSAEQSIISMDGQLSDNPQRSSLAVDSELERAIKNPVPQ